jgi:hypothetical protein
VFLLTAAVPHKSGSTSGKDTSGLGKTLLGKVARFSNVSLPDLVPFLVFLLLL